MSAPTARTLQRQALFPNKIQTVYKAPSAVQRYPQKADNAAAYCGRHKAQPQHRFGVVHEAFNAVFGAFSTV